jgi:cytochrome P450
MEGGIVLRQMTERFPTLHLAKDYVPEFHRSVGFRVPKSVMVAL